MGFSDAALRRLSTAALLCHYVSHELSSARKARWLNRLLMLRQQAWIVSRAVCITLHCEEPLWEQEAVSTKTHAPNHLRLTAQQ